MDNRKEKLMEMERNASGLVDALSKLNLEGEEYKLARATLDDAKESLVIFSEKVVSLIDEVNLLQNEVKRITTQELFDTLTKNQEQIDEYGRTIQTSVDNQTALTQQASEKSESLLIDQANQLLALKDYISDFKETLTGLLDSTSCKICEDIQLVHQETALLIANSDVARETVNNSLTRIESILGELVSAEKQNAKLHRIFLAGIGIVFLGIVVVGLIAKGVI